ncbi:hypothetical protein, partial [Xanthomonas phaseoli]|uniref:hypothetical protein n=2 Tax=Xanthomonas phaseoli TaxID=1985254 RepID=UPI001ED8CC72
AGAFFFCLCLTCVRTHCGPCGLEPVHVQARLAAECCMQHPLHAQAATSLADHLATSQYVLSAMQEPIAGYCNK